MNGVKLTLECQASWSLTDKEEMDMEPVVEKEKTHDHPDQGRDVIVIVDTVPHTVHRGHYIVSEFKHLVGVDPNRELEEVVNGEFKPLDDNGNLVIKGGEVFVSHA